MRIAGSLALIVAGLVLGAAAWADPHAKPRLYVRPKPVVFGLWFNPQSPVFANNAALERAINYALDRPALVRAWGRYAGRPTARIIPPGVLGYEGNSPYPLDRPDLNAAQELSRGNLRTATAVLSTGFNPTGPIALEIKKELAAIGLDVTVIPNRAPPCEGPHCPQPDLALGGWSADYPDPASFMNEFATQDQLARATHLSGASRREVFAQLDEDLMTQAPPVAPFMAANAAFLVSARTHCVHWNLYYGVDLNALCVR